MGKGDNLKYNYVICGCGGYYDIGYRDVMDLDSVNYYHSYFDCVDKSWKKNLIRLNFSKKINKIVKSPFKRFVYPNIYIPKFKNSKPLCFLFFGNVQYVYQSSFIAYIRKNYPESKVVLYMQDLVCMNPLIDFKYCQKTFDLILSYDRGDCQRYGLYFHPTPMSCVDVESDASLSHSDIYFCGYAKTRYPIIHDLYRKYTGMGIKCDFHIMNLPESCEKVEGIHYHEQNLTYEQNVQHIKSTKCILEIMQDGADGFTPRVWESIVYEKHLLTNNASLQGSEYFNEEFMHFIDDESIVSSISKSVTYDKESKNRLSPLHLLNYIDELLLNI